MPDLSSELIVTVGLSFQPALTVLDGVVDAMNVTHDILIGITGPRRISPVTWQIYGSDLAGVLARTRYGVTVDHPNLDRTTAGSLEEGFEILDRLLEEADAGPEDFVSAAAMRHAADGSENDVALIIAYCEIQ